MCYLSAAHGACTHAGISAEDSGRYNALDMCSVFDIISGQMEPNEYPWIDIAPGIRRQTITTGTTMYQMRAQLDAGSRLPVHQHPQEQIAHIVSGRMRMFVSGVPHELSAGQSIYLPSNVPHGVETLEDTLVIDTFSPPREDYLALDDSARAQG